MALFLLIFCFFSYQVQSLKYYSQVLNPSKEDIAEPPKKTPIEENTLHTKTPTRITQLISTPSLKFLVPEPRSIVPSSTKIPIHFLTNFPTSTEPKSLTEPSSQFPTHFPTSIEPSTQFPTEVPTKEKSDMQFFSLNPSLEPSKEPTNIPTTTSSTDETTKIEATASIPEIETTDVNGFYARNRHIDWFDYDSSSRYGPNYWSRFDVQNSEYFEFIQDHRNQCDHDEQSPVIVEPEQKCQDDHTPAHYRGKNNFHQLDFTITSSSLRVYLGNSETAPIADFSNLNNGFIPAVFVDIKMKSEHFLYGRQYAGEFQIYHYWDKGNGRFVVMSIMMDDSSDEENNQLEQFIREWEEVAWRHQNECQRKRDPSILPYNRTYSRLTREEMQEVWGIKRSKVKADYDIYRFQTTGWYCGYDGSLTEPPCSERVHWRILDLPMKMSKSQYERMQRLVLNRSNDKCERQTAAYQGAVNRPLQTNRNNVWCCTSYKWKFKEGKDSKFWFNFWPSDYHGWKGFEHYKKAYP